MRKLIMLSVLALGTITASASNELGNVFKTQISEQSEFGCYRITATTTYFENYSIVNTTQVTNYDIFVSISAVNAYIQNLKNGNPDNYFNGTGYKTTYSYTKVSNSNCTTINP